MEGQDTILNELLEQIKTLEKSNESLKKEIREYCDEYNYHYYISDNVDLKI